MVFDPANVARGFLGGVAAGQQQQARGLDIERMQKEMRAKEAQERKREQISGLLGQFVGGEGDRQQITGQLAGLGVPGVQALQTGTEFLQTQRAAEQQQATAEQTAAGEKLVDALPVIFANQDERVWKTQDFPYIADLFVKSGGDTELVRRLDGMPMNQAKQVMQQMFQEAKAPKGGNFKTYQSKSEPGKTYTLNMNNPDDVAFLEKNQDDLISAPTRGIVTADPGAFEPVTKPVRTAIQKEIISTEETVGRVNKIRERFDKDFLTYRGKARSFFAGITEKAGAELGAEEKQFIKERKKFEILVERDFNAYRRLITGAAASVQELTSLKKATLNMDQSPSQFEATMDIYQEELLRGLRLKQRLLREGIDTKSEGFGKTFDDLYGANADDDPDARLQELIAEGRTQEEAIDQMIEEGYE